MAKSVKGTFLKSSYRNIYILRSRKEWPDVETNYCMASDLVLTTDFGLHHYLCRLGAEVKYLDHLIDRDTMEKNNYFVYSFFRDWFKDKEGNDIFQYRGIAFGFAFRISILSELVGYVRLRLNLEALHDLQYRSVVVSTEFTDISDITDILKKTDIQYSLLTVTDIPNPPIYSFPIKEWVSERLNKSSWKRWLRNEFARSQNILLSAVNMIFGFYKKQSSIFIQNYYPTSNLISRLQRTPGIQVIQEQITPGWNPIRLLRERMIPTYGNPVRFQRQADILKDAFRTDRSHRLVLTGNCDVTDEVFQVIEECLSPVLAITLRDLNCVVSFFENNGLDLVVLIANLGKLSALVDCYAKSNNIPVYLIANGIFANNFLDESKYATVINGYSESVKNNYFCHMKNVVCLGDPRMDRYPPVKSRPVNRRNPVITVGASGFNNLDLNSYLAVEFDFMFDVLSAIKDFSNRIGGASVRIKVRANAYLEQYQQFLEEYFPSFVNHVFHMEPFQELLSDTDLFISINSQTIFEASCSGIPSIYYKKDNEFLNPPWDGKSEVVMASSREELDEALQDFYTGSDRFNQFMNRQTMEQYVGPLDGKNLERNYDQVLKMLDRSN